ncbi:MAG: M56 family metallopeptidase [Ginsengibacter sp.]
MDLATLQHSVFLYALGSAILNSLLQAFILWFLYEIINVFYKTATSGFKNKLSTLLMFTAFVWFIGTFISKVSFDEKEISSISSAVATAIPVQQASLNESTMQTILSNAAGVLPYLSISYIFLLLFLMIKLFTAYRYVYFIANKRLIVPPLRLQDFASKVALKMKIAKNIKVWLSNHVDVPATIGFIKPVILIPVASVNNLSSDQLEAIILHELSHIKRNDYLINLFISVIETILFFNPFILLLSKAVKRERENCCDDFVIQYRYDPHSYASALLSLEQSRRRNLQLSVAAVSGKKQLLMRIKRITSNKVAPHQFNYGQKLFTLLVMTGIIFSIGWLSPQEKGKTAKIQETRNPKQDISITTILQDRKTALGEGSNSQPIERKQRAVTLVKDQKATTATIKSDYQKAAVPEDNGMKSLVWNDFENNIQKFSDNGFKNAKLFNVQAMKFAPFKEISNFIFPKLDLNIDVAELNKNLALAYKEINAMDWNKIQANINESLSNINVERLTEIQKIDLLEEKDRYAELMRLQKKQANHLKTLLPQRGNYFFLNDTSQIAAIAFTGEDNLPVQDKVYSQAINKNHESGNYNYSYAPKAVSTSEFKSPRTRNSQKVFTVTGLDKNVKVIIEHISEAFKDGNSSFNFTSSSDKKESKEKKQKIIRIEVNELP